MPGTSESAKKARDTILRKYGPDYYKNIGKRGGKTTGFKGFALLTEKEIKKIVTKGNKASVRVRRRKRREREEGI